MHRMRFLGHLGIVMVLALADAAAPHAMRISR